jgi:hypothetical protein
MDLGEHIPHILQELSQYSNWLIAAVLFVIISYDIINHWNARAYVYRVAQSATRDFYATADLLLAHPNVPETLKTVLYDLLVAVTDDKLGKRAFDIIMRVATEGTGSPSRHANSLRAALGELRQQHPDLADQLIDAFRDGFWAIVCGHGHADSKVTITGVRTTSHNDLLVKVAGVIEKQIDALKPRPSSWGRGQLPA